MKFEYEGDLMSSSSASVNVMCLVQTTQEAARDLSQRLRN